MSQHLFCAKQWIRFLAQLECDDAMHGEGPLIAMSSAGRIKVMFLHVSDLRLPLREIDRACPMEPSDDHDILVAYTRGEIPRSVAMKTLGIDWYGELLDRLAKHDLRVRLDPAREEAMVRKAIKLLRPHV